MSADPIRPDILYSATTTIPVVLAAVATAIGLLRKGGIGLYALRADLFFKGRLADLRLARAVLQRSRRPAFDMLIEARAFRFLFGFSASKELRNAIFHAIETKGIGEATIRAVGPYLVRGPAKGYRRGRRGPRVAVIITCIVGASTMFFYGATLASAMLNAQTAAPYFYPLASLFSAFSFISGIVMLREAVRTFSAPNVTISAWPDESNEVEF